MSATRVRLLCNRSISLAEDGCFEEARAALREAAGLTGAGDNPELKGLVETALCRISHLVGAPREAVRHGRQAVRLLEQCGLRDDTARAIIYLAAARGGQGHHLEALNLFNEALTHLRASSNRRLLVLARWGLGVALGFLERYAEARDSLRVASERAEEVLSLVERGKLEASLGWFSLQLGEYEAAQAALDAALRLLEPSGRADLMADVYNSLGSLHLARGDRRAARTSFARALAVVNGQPSVFLAETHHELARLEIAEGRLPEALQNARSALAVAEKVGSRIEAGPSMLVLAQALLGLDRSDAAIPYLRRALKIFVDNGPRPWAVVAEDMLKFAETRAGRAMAQFSAPSDPGRPDGTPGNA
ncbi:MAG: tetratricopeptide repeat protein [Acetobacteraceae bacterium]|nr:tetratricopeptide repeat protein [Acetobacteraceae bacterium]